MNKPDLFPVVTHFTRVGEYKLAELQRQGFSVAGVAIERANEDGTIERGAVTGGGLVLWWSPQPAQQAVEPVAGEVFKQFIEWASAAGYDVANTYDTDRSRWLCLNPMTADLWKAWQAVHNSIAGSAAPTQQPLTDELKELLAWLRKEDEKEDYFGRKHTAKKFGDAANLIEAALGITGSKT